MAAFRPVSARPVAALAANSAALAASLAGQATLTAALSTGIPLAANFAVQATMTGSIPTGLVAAFAARATLGATLSTGIPLAANLAAQASTTAALSTGIQLAAFMGVNASLNGGLTAGPAADPSSWLCDDTELISGAWLASAYPGHGVLGVNVPSEGTDGPSALYGALSLPADNAVEVRGLITRWPVNGTLTIEEDGSFSYTGTTDYFEFLLYAGAYRSRYACPCAKWRDKRNARAQCCR